MTSTQVLLGKIAALRQRLAESERVAHDSQPGLSTCGIAPAADLVKSLSGEGKRLHTICVTIPGTLAAETYPWCPARRTYE